MVRTSRQAELAVVRRYLGSAAIEALVDTLLASEPWFCRASKTDFLADGERLLAECGLEEGQLFLVGSAAMGFSLAPAKAGRPFRSVDSPAPSDLDVALVHSGVFQDAWGALTEADRMGLVRSDDRVRRGVYWGRIDEGRLPRRTAVRRSVIALSAAIRRSHPYRGHKTSVRVYRRLVDLRYYTIDCFRKLAGCLEI